MRKYKIIFTGPVGAGKTTAIAAISDKPPISTNEAASDMTTSRKSQTTVAMDYGVKYLDNSDILHLYGTPGQERFNFMWDILTEGGLGLMLLIDNRRDNPFGDLSFYLNAFKEFIDSFALTASWPEALSDTAVTMLYPSVVLIIHRIKSDHS